MDLEDFFSEAKKYMDKHKHKGEQKYFTGYFFEPLYVMEDICCELVYNKNKKTKFNTPEFIDFLKDYKVISASICPTDIIVQQEYI